MKLSWKYVLLPSNFEQKSDLTLECCFMWEHEFHPLLSLQLVIIHLVRTQNFLKN